MTKRLQKGVSGFRHKANISSNKMSIRRSEYMPAPLCPLVGIGSSAGGLDELKKLFQDMPTDTGAALVVIRHLGRKHESLTAEILSRCTAIPAVQIKDGMTVESNHVYVIPPNAYLTLRGETLKLGGPVLLHGLRMPVDTFLKTFMFH